MKAVCSWVDYSSTCVIFMNKIVRGEFYHFSNFKMLREIDHVHSHAAVEMSTGCNHSDEFSERLTFAITIVFPLSPQISAVKSSQLLSVGK